MEEIKKCPFCRTDICELRSDDDNFINRQFHYVKCHYCLAVGPNYLYAEQAVYHWNKASEQIEKYEKIMEIDKAIEELNDVHRFDDRANNLSEEAKETINQILEMPLDEDTDEGYKGIEGFVPGLNCTVRECIGCKCLIAGGPTRCERCARELEELLKIKGVI
jgi:NADH:ubiquinone oxidoreductase subunit E